MNFVALVFVVVVVVFLVFTEFFKDVICLNFRHPSESRDEPLMSCSDVTTRKLGSDIY